MKTIFRTTAINLKHQTAIVQAIPINRQPVKTVLRTIPIQSPRSFVWTNPINLKHQTAIVQVIPIKRPPVKTMFRTILTDRQCPRSFVWTIPIN